MRLGLLGVFRHAMLISNTRLKKSNSKSRGGRTVGKRIKIELKFLNGICIQEALRSHTIVNPLGHRKRGVAKLGQEGSGIF